jgi:RNA polymerase sigma-70 factor (ECF subfamily)
LLPKNKLFGKASTVPEDDPAARDRELLRSAAAGDAAAFHALVDLHAARLYRLAVSLIGNRTDAEDVLQESFVGVFRGLRKFEARSSVKTWMTKILVVQVAKWRRDRKGGATELISRDISAEESVAAIGDRIDLYAAIAQLSEDHREVIVLRELEQLSYEEIASVLEVPRGTVESRLHRAREELRKKLKAYLP